MGEWEIGEGGIDVFACANTYYGRCSCGRCAKCGYPLHSAIHGHLLDENPGDRPLGHRFVPAHQEPNANE